MKHTSRSLRAFGLALGMVATAAPIDGTHAQGGLGPLDRNSDGVITFDEIRANRDRVFTLVDANADGAFDEAELKRFVEARALRRNIDAPDDPDWQATLAILDADRDGVVSRSEFIAFVPPRFRLADRDGNRAVTRDELQALARAVRRSQQAQ